MPNITFPLYMEFVCLVRESLMEKIVIIGSPGAGKTTLAVELEKILRIKVFHLDRIFWDRGWKRKSRDTRIDILYKIVQEKQWIIEGTYLSSSEPRLEEADTIIFLDIPLLLCLWRVIKRHRKNRGNSRRDLPMDSTDKLNPIRMLKVLAFSLADRKKLKQTLNKYESRRIIQLCSPKEVEKFLKEQKQGTQESSSDIRRFQPILSFAQT
jgi:adenylate kinase family enzyme